MIQTQNAPKKKISVMIFSPFKKKTEDFNFVTEAREAMLTYFYL